MGHGIALAFSRFGYSVKLYDNNISYLNEVPSIIRSEAEQMVRGGLIGDADVDNAMANIELAPTLEGAAEGADFIIEVVPEILELKQEIFKTLDPLCGEETIFASNTSSLRLKDVIQPLSEKRKARSIICHWFNPPHIIPLVELSNYGNMPEDIFKEVYELFLSIEKKPIKINQDVAGLVSNRLQNALAREAFYLMEEGVADAEDINDAITYGGTAFRMSVAGLTEIVDMGGIDIWTSVAGNLWGDLEDRADANQFLLDMVKAGKLGLKTGEGFSVYPEDRRAEIKEDFNDRLIRHLRDIV